KIGDCMMTTKTGPMCLVIIALKTFDINSIDTAGPDIPHYVGRIEVVAQGVHLVVRHADIFTGSVSVARQRFCHITRMVILTQSGSSPLALFEHSLVAHIGCRILIATSTGNTSP